MKLLRNPEIKKNLLCFGLFTLFASIGAFVWNAYFGIYTLAVCFLFVVIYLMIMYHRYKRISRLSESIDKLLHGDQSISFDDYKEGELGILQSELSKMTIRLREQQQHLQDDKIYLSDSIADISHQIRTPLTSINLIVSFLSEPDITVERRLTLTRELFSLLSRIDWLITTLLKISKLDAGTVQFKREDIALETLVQKAASPVLVPIELRGQSFSVNAEGSFQGDVSWTVEALGNIIKNCMEHTPEGGRIEVVAKDTALYSEIIISDNGSGIDKEDLPHIFERFYKGKDSGDNSFGIGLALARMIVTAQNGTLKAENGVNGGAVFTMRFYKGTV